MLTFALYVPSHERLDGLPIQRLSGGRPDLLAQAAPECRPDFVMGKGHEVKDLFLYVRRLGWSVLDPDRRRRELEVRDHLGGELLGSARRRSAGGLGKTRTDDDGGVRTLVGEVEADPAPETDAGVAFVRVDVVRSQVHLDPMIKAEQPLTIQVRWFHQTLRFADKRAMRKGPKVIRAFHRGPTVAA